MDSGRAELAAVVKHAIETYKGRISAYGNRAEHPVYDTSSHAISYYIRNRSSANVSMYMLYSPHKYIRTHTHPEL